MNRLNKINEIRHKLNNGDVTIGSWMQLPNGSVAEIMGRAGYDWVAVDLEHGAFSLHLLPDIFRALELGGTLPLVRLAQGNVKDCKQALDAGAGGVIVPMVSNAMDLKIVRDACCWPPEGNRGVGFSRANLFGNDFEIYSKEAQKPFFVAMIEDIKAVENLENIITVKGLDAILIGPYDLSASMGITAEFENENFIKAINVILEICKKNSMPCGVHVVNPDDVLLKKRIEEGYRFIAYSIDTVFLLEASKFKIKYIKH